jgi:hypothetical protein
MILCSQLRLFLSQLTAKKEDIPTSVLPNRATQQQHSTLTTNMNNNSTSSSDSSPALFSIDYRDYTWVQYFWFVVFWVGFVVFVFTVLYLFCYLLGVVVERCRSCCDKDKDKEAFVKDEENGLDDVEDLIVSDNVYLVLS